MIPANKEHYSAELGWAASDIRAALKDQSDPLLNNSIRHLVAELNYLPATQAFLSRSDARVHLDCRAYLQGVTGAKHMTAVLDDEVIHYQYGSKRVDGLSRGVSGFHKFVRGIIALMGGNEVELDQTHGPKAEPMPVNYWGGYTWIISDNEVKDAYWKEIHPFTANFVAEELKGLPSEPVEVVDLFGGTGDFARSLHYHPQVRNTGTRIHVVDNNRSSLSDAGNLAHKFGIQDFVHTHEIDLRREDGWEYNGRNSSVFPPGVHPQIVTAIGGLNEDVVTRVEAREIARKIYRQMPKEGKFIVTGYSRCLLNAAEFRKIGFKVLNMSIPEHMIFGEKPEQFYVLQK